jgi:hypothetical protein
MTAGICRVIIRMPWDTDYEVGSVELRPGDTSSFFWQAVADLMTRIAAEVNTGNFEKPSPEVLWFEKVDLREFTDSVPRDHSPYAAPGMCGAWPARAFRPRFLEGCVADEGHPGSHCTDRAMAERAARRAATIA